MYATPGVHTYGLPWGLLHDITDRGPLWDPALNAYAYTYNVSTDKLYTSTSTPDAPLSWFYYSGHWGDKFYPLNDSRQYRFGGQYHYVNGPLGPRFKHLGRTQICSGRGPEAPCVIRDWIGTKRNPSCKDRKTRTLDSNSPHESTRWSSSISEISDHPRIRRWDSIGTGEDLSEADLIQFFN